MLGQFHVVRAGRREVVVVQSLRRMVEVLTEGHDY